MLRRIFLLNLLISLGFVSAFGQAGAEDRTSFNESALPRTGGAVEKFVPPGWMIEANIAGDLNNDAVADAALKLVEKPDPQADQDIHQSRERALVILLKNAKGEFERVAVAHNLLQCTGCGGAFYGVVDAPADIEIKKGVLTLKQDFGSREVTELTFRFRYDAKVKKFALIGFEMNTNDRATGASIKESTNYLTGVKITDSFQYSKKLDKDVKKSTIRAKVAGKTQFIEDIDYEKMIDNQ